MPLESRRVIYLSPADDVRAAVLAAARAATRSLHVLAYAFTLSDLADVVRAKHAAGLAVGVVVDRTQSGGRAQKALLQKLVDAGVDVTITTAHGALMHQKILLVDAASPQQGGLGVEHNDSFVVYGSWNFSASSQAQANTCITENNGGLCRYFWHQYEDLRAYGRARYPQLTPAPTGGATTEDEGHADAPLA